MDPAFVEPTPRLELGTSFLPRMCSTTELCGLGTSRFEFVLRSLYGAGSRIRTYEAQGGRFTVCWV